uniref:Uncharacterized protein n=1 Tax=Panagrolaimus sp. ES5 TaxID=591445 RepID=A0AC34G5A6_9BILA
MQKLWKGEIKADKSDHLYAWGWAKRSKDFQFGGSSPNRTGYYYHTGAAVGASSVLLIRPTDHHHLENGKPYGICVVVLSNKQDAGKGLT